MKHIVFAFPAGAAGVALALFRVSAALWIAGSGSVLPAQDMRWTALTWLTAIGLLAGFPTRFLAGLCAVVGLGAAVTGQAYPLAGSGAFVLAMVALALIGPGAYSVDAILFGRRTIYLSG